MEGKISAAHFFKQFKKEMCENKYFSVYKRGGKSYTQFIIKDIIKNIIEKNNLIFQTEYYRIDCVGYTQRKSEIAEEANFVGLKPYLWDLHLSVEHENEHDKWLDEVNKLVHIKCPLKVVIGYAPFDCRNEIEEKKLKLAASLIERTLVFDDKSNEEFLIILGNGKGQKAKRKYTEFDFRGYLFNYSEHAFNEIK